MKGTRLQIYKDDICVATYEGEITVSRNLYRYYNHSGEIEKVISPKETFITLGRVEFYGLDMDEVINYCNTNTYKLVLCECDDNDLTNSTSRVLYDNVYLTVMNDRETEFLSIKN